ncbi:MAG TPA: hypothetical protein VK907_09545, partial [Phnomibacter sp.]|nr:hypothetical protein [Phnomibacter sp.]
MLLLATGWFAAKADHITGGEMTYQYAGIQNGEHLYRFSLRLLMRCNSGRVFPDPIRISVFENGNYNRVADLSVPLGGRNNISLTTNDPCISNPPPVCYEVADYYFDVLVPANQQGYTVSAQVNFRINGLANVSPGTTNIGATYTAEIPGNLSTQEAFRNSSAR